MSHPCLAAAAALRLKGVEFEQENLLPGPHAARIEELYGEGLTTVPGLTVGDEKIHGSTAILWRLEELFPEPSLYPHPLSERVREAEIWGDGRFQDLGRRLPWGALHFRPEAVGTFTGGEPLDPAGTDFAIRMARGVWKHHGISATLLAEDLQVLPELLETIEGFAREGLIDGDSPTAADLQIGASARVMLTVADLEPVLAGSVAERIARRHFPDYPGRIPAGAFPAGWVPGS